MNGWHWRGSARVRVLVDDGATTAGDEQLLELNAHPSIEIRIFNPFVYRGHVNALRAVEFMFNARRLDYRMHNKLLVVDNAAQLSATFDEYWNSKLAIPAEALAKHRTKRAHDAAIAVRRE